MILCIANTKGGVGKTTTALMTALTLAREGRHVEVWDADPQASMTGWADKVDDPPFAVVPTPSRRLTRDRATAEETIIDTPPGGVEAIQAGIDCSDVVVIPLIVGAFSLERTIATVHAAEGKPHAVLVVAAEPWKRLHKATMEVLDAADVPVLTSMIPKRVKLSEDLESGTVPEEDYGYAQVLTELFNALKGIEQ